MAALGITERLQTEFNDPKPLPTKLHYIMAHHDYDGDRATLVKAVDLVVKLGKVTLNQTAGKENWTPLQVAVLTGYRLGVECLIGKGVKPSEQAWEYASTNHPELLPLLGVRAASAAKVAGAVPMAPHNLSESRRLCLKTSFEVAIPLPEASFTYQAGTNDFGVVIRQLLLSQDITPEARQEAAESKVNFSGEAYALDIRAQHLNANMRELGEMLGFEVISTHQSYYPRDHFVPQPEQGFMSGASGHTKLASSEQIQRAINLGISFQVRMEDHAGGLTDHLSFSGVCGSTANVGDAPIIDYKRVFKKDCPEGILYLEGGNVYRVTNPAGKVHVFVGSSLFAINLALGHLAGTFQRNIDSMKASGTPVTFPSSFINAGIYQLVKEMFALGRIKIRKQSGVISRLDVGLLQEAIKAGGGTLKEVAVREKKMVPLSQLNITPEKNLSSYGQHPTVRRYAYDRQIMTQFFGRTLGLDASNIQFLPQQGYHLDTFMRPGPKGTMLIQDYVMVKHFLEVIQRNHETFELTHRDMEILERYIATAKKLDSDLKGLEHQCSGVLKRAGIRAIPIPAVFYDASLERVKQPTYHVNFINGISGFSQRTGKYYYITTGAQVGDNLGQALMDTFTFYLQHILPEIDVFFVGRNPLDPRDYSESMKYWNRPGDVASQSGLHCMSVETVTRSHRHE